MEPNPKLEEFLPRLRAALLRKGMSAEAAEFVCRGILVGAQQPPLTTLAQYQEAWTVCHEAQGILTTIEDGSEAAVWLRALVHAVIDFEDTYIKQHGHAPLHAGPPETEETTGSA